jgi:hypothetical protein
MSNAKGQELGSVSIIIDMMLECNTHWIDFILSEMDIDPGSARANQIVRTYLDMIEAEYRRKYDV